MVVQAVQDLTGGADRVPLETRQELAKIAAKVFENAESTTKEGMLGDVEYRIGRYAFTSRPNFNSIKFDSSPPNRGVKTLWMPFVAVRLVDPAVTHYQRGVAEMKSGFWVLAQDEFEAAVRLDERFARAYVRRAQVYLHGEKYSDAWADFEKAVELEPRGVSCRLFYALALITAQERARADLTKAKAAAEKACELTGQRDPLCLQILAAVHARTGDFEKAAECQNRALALLYEAERGEIPGRRLDLYKKGLLNNLDFDEERIELCRPESPR
jgi:tetratricopeptide (TPR) repeat protein